VISGTNGAGAGAGTAGAGAAFVLAVVDREEELGEAKERGASGPSIIIEMMRQTIMVFEV
jgi:hypothetical protein